MEKCPFVVGPICVIEFFYYVYEDGVKLKNNGLTSSYLIILLSYMR